MAMAKNNCACPVKTVKVGPFGGQGGQPWDDGTHTTIRRMTMQYNNNVMESIQIEYDQNGLPILGIKHGDSNGGQKAEVKLDFPDEFLISISGYLTEDSCRALVRSLTLETNKKKYGPFGVEKGKQFSTSATSGKLIGFLGRSGLDVDAIGAYIQPFPVPQYKSDGPYGGQGGLAFDDGIYTTVRQLVINSGDAIDSIQIEYDKEGRSKWSDKHGQSQGGQRHLVQLDYPGEFIIAMSGSYKSECGLNVIRSLKIETNRKTYGPFGNERGQCFETPKESGKIIGFFGRSGLYLDSIGVHYEPIPDPPRPLSCGPFGGCVGSPWDDGYYTTIRQLIIYSGYNIDSILIEYDNKGRSKWSQKHGTSTGGDKNIVKLNYPGEFIHAISGYYGDAFGTVVIRSLTIQTNKKTYGPFGVEKGTPFKLPPTNGKIVGFHGRAGLYLDSIGAYYEPFPIQ